MTQMTQTTSKAAERRSALGSADIEVTVDGLDEAQIKSVLLADGWHNILEGGAELVQFAIGRAHSPLTPSKTWTYFRYINEQDMLCYSPVDAVLAVSPNVFPGIGQTTKTSQPQTAGTFQQRQ